jgi:hypothetical protein
MTMAYWRQEAHADPEVGPTGEVDFMSAPIVKTLPNGDVMVEDDTSDFEHGPLRLIKKSWLIEPPPEDDFYSSPYGEDEAPDEECIDSLYEERPSGRHSEDQEDFCRGT